MVFIAIRTNKDAWRADWQWQQTAPLTYEILLLGPLGTNTIKLTAAPQHVSLTGSNGQHVAALNADELLAQQLGWALPISNLYYWIRGLPAPNQPAQKKLDAYHHLIT